MERYDARCYEREGERERDRERRRVAHVRPVLQVVCRRKTHKWYNELLVALTTHMLGHGLTGSVVDSLGIKRKTTVQRRMAALEKHIRG